MNEKEGVNRFEELIRTINTLNGMMDIEIVQVLAKDFVTRLGTIPAFGIEKLADITLEKAMDIPGTLEEQKIGVSKIADTVCLYYGLPFKDVFSKKRDPKLSLARKVIYYLAGELTDITCALSGTIEGRRRGCDFKKEVKKDRSLQRDIKIIKCLLAEN